MDRVIVVSACLLGVGCRYDGRKNLCKEVVALKDSFFLLPVCPEQLGGLPTPRPPAKIYGGDGFSVIEGEGRVLTVERKIDVTSEFLKGAVESVKLADIYKEKVVCVILKERSPSCGVKTIYNFNSDTLKQGKGVAAALFIRNGYKVISSEELEKIKKLKREFK
ncbi:DUF523 domain-containing protein [Desulfurobacterium atlanticum]|nr:DUF523 domain-containing protein [Desulfurobacterium atlanticum]